MTVTTFKPVSDKQVAFIAKLAGERVHGHLYVETQLATHGAVSVEDLSSNAASNIIGVLLKEPKVPSAQPKFDAVAPGHYVDPEGTVFEVVKAKTSTNVYAKALVVSTGANGKPKGRWTFVPGAMKAASTWSPITLPEAVQYGKKVGVCCMCGRTLTVKASIEAGIGPICAGKF